MGMIVTNDVYDVQMYIEIYIMQSYWINVCHVRFYSL